jgi:hypothetical protein
MGYFIFPESPQHTPHEKIQWPTNDVLHSTDNKISMPESTVQVNGVQALEGHDGTDEEVEEELKRCTGSTDATTTSLPDNTSQDSVVSANTDSGLCSASEEASPLPPPADPEASSHALVSSGSDETLVITWTPQLSEPSSLPSMSPLPDSSSSTVIISSDVVCDSTVPESISTIQQSELESQKYCDPVSTQSDGFGEFETAFSISNEILVNEQDDTSEVTSSALPIFCTLEDGVPLPTGSSSASDIQCVIRDISQPESNDKVSVCDSENADAIGLVNPDKANNLGVYEAFLSNGDVSSSNCLCEAKNSSKSDLSLDVNDNDECVYISTSNADQPNISEITPEEWECTEFSSQSEGINQPSKSPDTINVIADSCEDENHFSDFKFVPPSEIDNDVDDFGDFEAAPIVVQNKTETVQTVSMVDDDFDDFADFSSAPQVSSSQQDNNDNWAQSFTETSLPTQETNEVEDDFDDFESAETLSSSTSLQVKVEKFSTIHCSNF